MSHRQIKVLAEQAVKAERERQTHRKFNARMRLQAEQRLHLNGDDHHDPYGDNEDEDDGNECEEVDEELERMHQWFIGLDTVNLK